MTQVAEHRAACQWGPECPFGCGKDGAEKGAGE